jgi:phosphopantetheinyl transferase
MLAARSFSQNDFRLADSNYAVPSQTTASNKKEQKFMVLWTKRESFTKNIML